MHRHGLSIIDRVWLARMPSLWTHNESDVGARSRIHVVVWCFDDCLLLGDGWCWRGFDDHDPAAASDADDDEPNENDPEDYADDAAANGGPIALLEAMERGFAFDDIEICRSEQ